MTSTLSPISEDIFNIPCFDPSEVFRPEPIYKKNVEKFRDFAEDENDPIKERVRNTYLKMHKNQTLDFVKKKHEYWCRFDKCKLTVMEAMEKLNSLVDESDPDVNVPNIIHGFQTAEAIRKAYPEIDWLHLTGLIHDMGKVMALYGEEQWAVVGDTFPVGCAFANSIVYRETTFNDSPDLYNPLYNTRLGIYKENCGLDQVTMSWGHDEYLYRVLMNHEQCRLPLEALYIIRYHSFYPWHASKDYMYLCNQTDLDMLKWVKLFNEFDLYTKADEEPNIDLLLPYYQSLIDKYLPGVISF